MNLDALRGYLQLASGLTDVTRERARAAARALVAQGEASVGAVVPPAVGGQVKSLTDDLLAASRANRSLLTSLIRAEVDRSVARLGLVSAAELNAATRRNRSLERRVEELEQELARARTATKASSPSSTARRPAARKSTARKSTARKATARKSTATGNGSSAKETTSGGSSR